MSTAQPNPDPFSTQASEVPLDEQDWLSADLSRLEDYEPYDWGVFDPLTLGHPVEYVPDVGIVVVTEDHW